MHLRPSIVDSRAWRTAAICGQALLIGGIVLTSLHGDWSRSFTLVLFLGGSIAFMRLEERLPTLFDFLFVVAALINAGGWAWNWYKVLGPYDAFAHGFTVFAITLSLGFLVYRSCMGIFRARRALFFVTICSFGIALGAVWEVVEWVLDYFFSLSLIPGIDDTISDLVLDTLGALAAATLSILACPPEQPGE